MQLAIRMDGSGQGELSEQAAGKEPSMPRVRPTADAELEEVFLRAAASWLRWRERRKWSTR